MITSAITHISQNYQIENKKLFSKNPLANFIRNDFAESIRGMVDLRVKASCGQGQWATIPWIAIFDERMTISAQKGIYIVLLFKEDMSGFYLTLNQGVTYYNDVIKQEKVDINKMAIKFIQDNIYHINGFDMKPIKIYTSKVSKLNYEDTNVLSKYYPIEFIDEKTIVSDIQSITKLYTTFIDGLINKNYEDFLKEISTGNLSTISTIDPADQAMFEALQQSQGVDESQFIIVENTAPHFSPGQNTKINSRVIKKKDYLDEHKNNMDLGMLAEELIIKYEIDRLKELGVTDPEKKVKWVSKDIGDGMGYDIQSVDTILGIDIDRYIEVKGTNGSINTPFFLSKNELEFSEKNKNSYYLYRLYNIKKTTADIFILHGDMNDKLVLVPTTYRSYVK